MKTLEQINERLEAMASVERASMIEFLIYLEVLDRRRLYAKLAYSSTYAYCTERLRLTDSSACRRIKACRLLRRFPVIEDYIRSGRVSLAKLATLECVLEADGCVELLDRAATMTEYEVKVMVAELRPDATSVPEVKLTPLTAELTEVKLVVSEAWIEYLGYATRALSHQVPNGRVPDVIFACMKKVADAHERRHYGATKRRAKKAPVRRAVWTRDEGRCTFTAVDGTRCNSQHQLEEHHIIPAAKGGKFTVENMTLHCRAHNIERARMDYGEAHMAQFMRGEE